MTLTYDVFVNDPRSIVTAAFRTRTPRLAKQA
jgi:hypothetical protein